MPADATQWFMRPPRIHLGYTLGNAWRTSQGMQRPYQQAQQQQGHQQSQPQRRVPPAPRRRKPANQYDSADEVRQTCPLSSSLHRGWRSLPTRRNALPIMCIRDAKVYGLPDSQVCTCVCIVELARQNKTANCGHFERIWCREADQNCPRYVGCRGHSLRTPLWLWVQTDSEEEANVEMVSRAHVWQIVHLLWKRHLDLCTNSSNYIYDRKGRLPISIV